MAGVLTHARVASDATDSLLQAEREAHRKTQLALGEVVASEAALGRKVLQLQEQLTQVEYDRKKAYDALDAAFPEVTFVGIDNGIRKLVEQRDEARALVSKLQALILKRTT
jgi:hypothetical protein